MRTTIDLPADLYVLVRQIAHDTGQSMSEVVVALSRAGLNRSRGTVESGPRGMPIVSIGQLLTSQDVSSLDDDD